MATPSNVALSSPSSSYTSSAKTHCRLASLSSTTLLLSLATTLLVLTVIWLKHYPLSPNSVGSLSPGVGTTLAPTRKPIWASTSSGRFSSRAKRIDNLERLELGLARSRSLIKSIEEANRTSGMTQALDYVPRGAAYRNPSAFYRSYVEMEKHFHVYIYKEGEPPLFHDGPCRSTYSTEGRFIYNMEADTNFQTGDPEKAHVYFLPFSVSKMVKYQRKDFDISDVHVTIKDYVQVIRERYPFWNRSLGSDHFMVSCHDWGPKATSAYCALFENSIRVLCNANTSEGFNPIKDVTLPEMNLRKETADVFGESSHSSRRYLAFFAGRLHGSIRDVLLKHWVGKDEDIQIYRRLPAGISYYGMMNNSKYCICPSGFEVASPRIVEAIYSGCVPVIISDHYILPFSDVLDWEAFSVQVTVAEIPNLKNLLSRIPSKKYETMKNLLQVVRTHFTIKTPPQRFDMFHMVLHSIWLRRLNMRIHGPQYG